MTGGAGEDEFRFFPANWDGDVDTITDFEVTTDEIVIGGGHTSADVSFLQTGSDVLVTLTTGDTILFENWLVSDLDSFSDFREKLCRFQPIARKGLEQTGSCAYPDGDTIPPGFPAAGVKGAGNLDHGKDYRRDWGDPFRVSGGLHLVGAAAPANQLAAGRPDAASLRFDWES